MKRQLTIVGICLALFSVLANAEQLPSQQVNTDGKYSTPQQKNRGVSNVRKGLSLRKINQTNYKIGDVLVDLEKREVSFPVTLEKREGNLEYALVNNKGKIHESLFISDCSSAQIHYGAMLLGAKRGEAIEVIVSWKTHGPAKVYPLEELIGVEIPKEEQGALSHWYYSGHVHANGMLNAQTEESMIALINDSSALVNRAGSKTVGRDDIYLLASPFLLPQKGLPMTVTFRFQK